MIVEKDQKKAVGNLEIKSKLEKEKPRQGDHGSKRGTKRKWYPESLQWKEFQKGRNG